MICISAFFLFSMLLLLHNFMASSAVEVRTNITTDQSALLALKDHINDPHKILASNWSTSTSVFCNWIGLTCGAKHLRVTALNLSHMGLSGTIAPQVGNLTFISGLSFRDNNFHGSLPNELAALRRLEVVSFGMNNFSGLLPSWLGFLPKVQVLYAYANSFDGTIPESLGNMDNTSTFTKSVHHKSQIPPANPMVSEHTAPSKGRKAIIPLALTPLKRVSVITMIIGWCQFIRSKTVCLKEGLSAPLQFQMRTFIMTKGLVEESKQIGEELSPISLKLHASFSRVFALNTSENRVTEYFQTPRVPSVHLTRSVCLILGAENWRSFTLWIFPIVAHSTGLSTKIFLFVITGLSKSASISHSESSEGGGIEGLTDGLELFRGMGGRAGRSVMKRHHGFRVKIHASSVISNDPSCLLVSVRGKMFSHTFISSFSNHPMMWVGSLQIILIVSSPKGIILFRLTGLIPSAIFNSSKIEVISLYMNNFSGHLPSSIGHWLPNLEVLYLWDNILEGIIPKLGANYFSGTIPNTLGNLWYLETLNLANNFLTRESSSLELSFLSSLTNYSLKSIVLADNPLKGTLPTSIGNFSTSLEEFVASNCNVKGTTPMGIGNSSNLNILSLENNELVGPIPTTIRGMNNLQGSIPDGICQLRNLVELFLNHNKLLGPIPACWGSLSKLQKLYLDSNKLTSITSSFWNVGNLGPVTHIDLSWNQLSSDIQAIRGLDSLANLSLAHNKLQGPIPWSFGKLISTVCLDLSDNNLSGEIFESLIEPCLKYINVSFNRLQGKIPYGGVIAQFSAQSFMGNQALCDPPQLKVPPCETNAKQKGQGDLLPLATWRRITYLELKQAIDGFSESNLFGKGSFGSVYRGTLLDGTSIASSIRHRNLVKIISSYNSIDFKALVLEYMSKGSLKKWLYSHNHFLDMLQRLNMMIDVASSLEYLHHGCPIPVVHCDLKPRNILLNKDMVAHVTDVSDFGISKFLGNEDFVAQTMTMATIGYMAPDYGSQGIISTRSDVYIYDILLMETFTRKNPTNEMFVIEMSLKCWVKQALLDSVIEVIDANLLKRGEKNFNAKLDCMLSIMKLAMDCSIVAPQERLNMRDVVTTLKNIKFEVFEGRWSR
ncbi:hypothetical protein RGQ29_028077 [Quercus rubra]|uniref:non-specific serine/threonine protein kinase n=1 Tax=Quercus rubra TaxID=3512 RepID=A0AAN7ERW3_QUERU|nr:hypothetical protein RGQ29_028077 [Quercus rubra]